MGSVFLSIDQSHIQEQPKKIHICSCCGDSIVGEHYILSQTDMLCSEECFKIYRENKFNRPRKVCKSKNMCVHCKSEILTDDFISHEHKKFCSDTCFQEWREHDILIKCRRGELSFLDIPKEIREKYDGRISKRTVTASNECVICGCIFYTVKSERRKTCSPKCLNIRRRQIGERYKLMRIGWNTPGWKGGVSYGVYCQKFNADLRRRVRAFFGNKCFLCGKPQAENKRKLAVHHVNYNKAACCDSSKVMLVPLCEQCHGKTNKNRKYWEDYFETILREKYNYKCYYTKEEYNNLKSEECSS